jgi:hypothetical protein
MRKTPLEVKAEETLYGTLHPPGFALPPADRTRLFRDNFFSALLFGRKIERHSTIYFVRNATD